MLRKTTCLVAILMLKLSIILIIRDIIFLVSIEVINIIIVAVLNIDIIDLNFLTFVFFLAIKI
jgi:hypothetical protein